MAQTAAAAAVDDDDDKGKSCERGEEEEPVVVKNNSSVVVACVFCEKLFDKINLFTCLTCNTSSADPTSSSNNKKGVKLNHYCKACILAHVRKKHEIVDHKGYKPAVCPEHETLCFLFCSDCKIVFCFECIEKHAGHCFIAVSTKAAEVRGTIYECMGQYEELMKPLKHRAAVVRNSLESIRQFRCSLTGGENLVKTLSGAFTSVIAANEAVLVQQVSSQTNAAEKQPKEKSCFSKNQLEALQYVAGSADRNLLKLKNMLQMSDGVCISNYIAAKDILESSIGDQIDELKRHAYLEWTPSLSEIVVHSVINAIGLVKIPEAQNEVFNAVLLNAEEMQKVEMIVDWKTSEGNSGDEVKESDFGVSSEIFQLRVENEKVRVGVLRRRMCKRSSVTSASAENGKEEFSLFWDANFFSFNNCSVQSVFRVRDRIAFYMKDTRDVFVYCLDTSSLIHAYKLADNLHPLKFRLLMNKTSFFVVWNSDKRRVEFYHLSPEKGFLAMKAQPELVNSHKDTFVFVDKQNNLTVYDKVSKVKLEVSYLHHGMFHIDNILFETSNVFRMFDYKFMTSLKCTVDLSKAGSGKRFSVENFTKFTFPLPVQPCVEYMGVMDDMYYVFADGKFFSAGI